MSYSEDLKHYYDFFQLLLFHFQNKESEKFFGLIEDNLKQVHPLFQTVFKTFLKDKEKIGNARQCLWFLELWKLQKKDFYRSEHQKRKDEFCPFSSLAFLQPTTVDKEPEKREL